MSRLLFKIFNKFMSMSLFRQSSRLTDLRVYDIINRKKKFKFRAQCPAFKGGLNDQTAKQVCRFWRKDQGIGNFGVADSSHRGTFVSVFNTDRA